MSYLKTIERLDDIRNKEAALKVFEIKPKSFNDGVERLRLQNEVLESCTNASEYLELKQRFEIENKGLLSDNHYDKLKEELDDVKRIETPKEVENQRFSLSKLFVKEEVKEPEQENLLTEFIAERAETEKEVVKLENSLNKKVLAAQKEIDKILDTLAVDTNEIVEQLVELSNQEHYLYHSPNKHTESAYKLDGINEYVPTESLPKELLKHTVTKKDGSFISKYRVSKYPVKMLEDKTIIKQRVLKGVSNNG